MSAQTVLVVEDNPITRKMLRAALQVEGYSVLEAGDGRSALALAQSRPIDLIVADYVLPDMDGLELLESLRRLPTASGVPALVVTGLGSSLDELRTRAGPRTEFLLKPVAPSLLVEVVKASLAPADPRLGRGRKVLLVDDDPVQRKLAVLLLEQAGFRVEAVDSGAGALAHARVERPDTVLADVLMPGMDGFALTQALRREPGFESVPVVLMSAAYAEEDDRRLAAAVGASALVLRGPDFSQVTSALVEALGAPSPAPPTNDIAALHRDRLQRLLERELARRDARLRHSAIQSAALSVVRGLADMAARPAAVTSVLGDILVHCLDAAGLSTGLLYLLEDGRGIRLQSQAGLASARRPGAERAFDLPGFLQRVMAAGDTQGLTERIDPADPEAGEFRARFGLSSALLVPLRTSSDAQGLLVLGSDSHDLTDPVWTSFAQALAAQFAESIALARALVRQSVWEERYRLLMEGANDGILVLDAAQCVLEANAQAEKLLGRSRSELAGRTYPDLVAPDERADADRGTAEMMLAGVVQVGLRHLVAADGERVPVEISGSVVGVGERSLLLLILHDLRRRRRGEQRLLAHHRATRALEGATTLRDAGPRVLRVIAESLDWQEAAVWRVDDAAQELRCVDFWAARSVSIPEFEAATRGIRFARGTGVPGRVWESGSAQWIADVAAEPNMPRGPIAAREGLRTACSFPVRVEGEIVAVVEYFASDRRERDAETLKMFTDVSAQVEQFVLRRRAEQALAASTERLQHVVASSPGVLYSLKVRGDRLTASWLSPNVERIFGYSVDESLRPTWWLECVHPADRGWVTGQVATLFAEGHIEREYRFRHKDGSFKWIRDEQRLLRDKAGTPAEVVGSWSDITLRKQAEQLLRERDEEYRLLFQSNPHPMWVYDVETLAFLAANEAAIARYGHSEQEFLRMTLEDIREPAEIPFLRESVEALRSGRPNPHRDHDWRHRTRDGRLIDVEISGGAIRFRGRDARLILAHDVTERKALEAQFLQSQKMESVGRLAGGVAHDFNNLLGVITGYAELLRTRVSSDAKLARYADDILRAANRAADLTRQLLAFSRKQVLQPRLLDLNDVVEQTERMLRRLIREDARLATALASDAGTVLADRGQLEQVIMNLAVNARDAMPRGGLLTIETARLELDEEESRLRPAVVPGRYSMLAISDTGEGMTPEVQARVFEPFFTTKEAGKGTGLGLATVWGIVKQSGGHVFVHSEPGRGTSFRIYLPRAERQRAADTVARPAPPARGSETVLLVEDEGALRELTRECLADFGYEVLAAGSSLEAIALAERHAGAIHLLITDVVMPGMGGVELARHFAEVRPEAKVVFISGYTDDAVVREGVSSETMAFLQKPFSVDALARKVREVLDTH